MEGPLPPLTKIDDDVEGVEVEVMLALKSMRCGRGCGGRGCDVGRFVLQYRYHATVQYL